MSDTKEFHRAFYSSTDKTVQDSFIVKFILVKPPKRDRHVKENSSRKRIVCEYFVKVKGTEKFQIQVCQQTFINILNVSKDRIQRIARNFMKTGEMPKENRGGNHQKPIFNNKKCSVKEFIEKLTCVESHYCRGTSTRQYLQCNMSIQKIFELYNSQASDELKVTKTFFRNIFCRDYNIGFGAPITDACSTCIELSERIKKEQNLDQKNKLQIERQIHKLRAKAFFRKLSEENEEVLCLSYDCQKNLVNPKIPDQIAYYSRQLYTYNFTIVKGSSHSELAKSKVFAYTWMEHEFCKESNQIASAVFHCLSQMNLSEYKSIRLCADGCGGQNRNSTVIAMCLYFLHVKAPENVESIELVFPITGHSFIPPDRVFGGIEKQLLVRKMPVIINPNDYIDIFNQHATVIKLKDCGVFDWKTVAKTLLKSTNSWHFKFNTCKRFYIERSKHSVTVRGERNYETDTGIAKSVFKKGCKISHTLQLCTIPVGVPLKPAKINDVQILLKKHFGAKWEDYEECEFYKNLFSNVQIIDILHEEEENFCEQNENEPFAIEKEMFI